MQKIMYDDNYGLTEATLHELKDMTRRIAYNKELKNELHTGWDESGHLIMCDGWMQVARSKYAVGEEVAIAQSYKTLLESEYMPADIEDAVCELVRQGHAGCTNKMFVKAELMPKRIRIKAIKLERLQDITHEDCLREGIYKHNALPDALGEDRYKFISYAYDATQDKHRRRKWLPTPREAFAALIDKVSGKGTWNLNPWVFVYEFELIK